MAAVGIDIGGTFTDVVIMHDDGSIDTSKSPSTPGRLLEGLLAALTLVAEKEGSDLDALFGKVDRISHGTTAATNAFIERRGAKVAILTTRGFEDTMIMQRMMGMTAGLSASELTDYSNRRVPEPLVPRSLIFGIRERVDYRGDIISPLREQDIYDAIDEIKKAGVKVAMLTVPAEAAQEVADLLVEAGVRAILNYAPVSLSVPQGVRVQHIDPAVHLQNMTYYLD